ncbi:MAG: hypothetical protein K6F97_03975 [Lachnospiraceae bacterium]|nr:hypothetical protein [Lachnospiraceae bacterium]
MKKKIVFAFCAALMLTACMKDAGGSEAGKPGDGGKQEVTSEASDEGSGQTETQKSDDSAGNEGKEAASGTADEGNGQTETQEVTSESAGEGNGQTETYESGDAADQEEGLLYFGGRILSASESSRVKECVSRAEKSGDIEVISPNPLKTFYTIESAASYGAQTGKDLTVKKCLGRYGKYLYINGNYYEPDEELDALAQQLSGTPEGKPEGSGSRNTLDYGNPIENRMYTYSVKCAEPDEDEDYIRIGDELARMWLDSLKDESGSYQLKTYEITSGQLWGKGIVGNGREFCVEYYFDAFGTGENSVFEEPEDSGYNTFYHYYNGPGIYIRCRYENGAARIVDHTGLFLADLASDLNGISEDNKSGYDTFFDFYNDKAAVEQKNAEFSFTEDGIVAQSPIMLADGRFSGVAVYPRDYEFCTEVDGRLLGVFDNAYYNEHGNTYSSPVDFEDGSGACTELYDKSFELLFDDYNCDGNPEFALKQDYSDEDAGGARYEVRCMSNDQTPRSDRFDFFMAGRNEPCIRLQKTGRGKEDYVRWSSDDNGRLIPSQTVEDYRMYSQRYYLPPSLRGYDDETQIQCFLWNNTAGEVKTGKEYTIEDKQGNVIQKGTLAAPVKVRPYREAQITFDVDVSSLGPGEYGIRISCGKTDVTGGFYVTGSGISLDIECLDGKLYEGACAVEFTVKNTGKNSVRLFSAELMHNGKKAGEAADMAGVLLAADDSKTITIVCDPLEKGEYYLSADCGESITGGKVIVTEGSDKEKYRMGGTAKAVLSDKDLTIYADSKEDAYLGRETVFAEIKTESGYKKSAYAFLNENVVKGENVFVLKDPAAEAEESDIEDIKTEFIAYFEEAMKEEPDEIDEYYVKEYEKIKAMTLKEFSYYIILGEMPAEAGVGARGRVLLGDEYVYFTIE